MTSGSSNAAAYIAGVVAVLKAAEPGLRPRHLLRLARPATAPRTSASGVPDRSQVLPSLSPNSGSAAGGIVLTGPRGRTVAVQVSPRAGQSGSAELLPPPVPRSSSSEAPPPEDRVWRTPSRARLAEVMRADR